ncbi:MAG: transglutaminase-like domain-containing protein [Verrucomicrobiota bacterium]|nr:transglutaminase-like domain-containing protein [Verrucomicrobiota bacterium]
MNKNKNIYVSFFSAWVLLCPSLVFAVTGDAPHILFSSLALLLISVITRKPFNNTVRSYVYASTTVILLGVFMEILFPVDTFRFFLLPIELVLPFFLFTGIAITFFRQTRTTISLITAISIITMMLSAGVVSSQINVRFDPGIAFWNSPFKYYYIISIVDLIGLLFLNFSKNKSFLYFKGDKKRKLFLKYIIIITAFIVTLASSELTLIGIYKYQHIAETGLNKIFAKYISAKKTVLKIESSIDISENDKFFGKDDGNKILFRVLSKSSPGYMRGRVYSHYESRKWSATSSSKPLQAEAKSEFLTVSTFKRKSAKESFDKTLNLTIFPVKEFASDILFAPGGTRQVEIVADKLKEDVDGTFTIENADYAAGYSIISSNIDAYNAPILRTFENSEKYLNIPENIRKKLSSISDKVFKNTVSAEKCVLCLSEYFSKGFDYKFPPETSKNTDPIIEFITKSKAGHCELFASAAAMLMRIKGIPTRYIFGVVCNESTGSDRWIARKADLHAWIEAYSFEKGKWFSVEISPATIRPNAKNKIPSTLSKLYEAIVMFLKNIFAQIKRGMLLQSVMSFLSNIFAFIKSLYGVLFIIFLVLITGIPWLLIRKNKKREKDISEELRMLHKLLSSIEKKLKKEDIERCENMTIKELINKIKMNGKNTSSKILKILTDYEKIRYSPDKMTIENITKLNKQLAESFK